MKLTEARRRRLQQGVEHPLGLIEWVSPKTVHYQGFLRTMKGLERDGLVRPYVHGDYEITDAGRAALRDGS